MFFFILYGCNSVYFLWFAQQDMGKTKTMRASRTEEALKQALAAVKDGMSQRNAADNFKIPRRTLRNHIKYVITRKTLGRKSVLTIEQEQDLVRRIIRYSEVGMPITVPMFIDFAR